MQNYDGQFKLNGQEYFYRAKDGSGSSKITRVNNEEHHYRMLEIKDSDMEELGEQMLGKLQNMTDEEFAEFSLEAAE